jgi:hypothetical protein
MVGFIVDAGHALGSAAGHTSRAAAPFEPSRGSPVSRMLWGATLEHCAECGVEVAPADAYRSSVRAVYCSIEHATRDLE